MFVIKYISGKHLNRNNGISPADQKRVTGVYCLVFPILACHFPHTCLLCFIMSLVIPNILTCSERYVDSLQIYPMYRRAYYGTLQFRSAP